MMNPHQAKTLYEGAANKESRQIVLRLLASNRFDAGAGASFGDTATDSIAALFVAIVQRAMLDALGAQNQAVAGDAISFLEYIGLGDWPRRLESMSNNKGVSDGSCNLARRSRASRDPRRSG